MGEPVIDIEAERAKAFDPNYRWWFAGPSIQTSDAVLLSLGVSPDYHTLSNKFCEIASDTYRRTERLRRFEEKFEPVLGREIIDAAFSRINFCGRWACVDEHGRLLTYSDHTLTELRTSSPYGGGLGLTWVRLSDFAIFCDTWGWSIPSELRALIPEEDPNEGRGGQWPWGEYETKLLQVLADAVKQWWTTYDPATPATAPKRQDVVAYLEKRLGPNRSTMAGAIATIIRADNAPVGRPKSG